MFCKFASVLAALTALLLASAAFADPGDVDAAARGVVRVVLISEQPATNPEVPGETSVVPVSHGSGFAVAPGLIVTNAHVIREALLDDTLRIGIVPSESVGSGNEGAFARAVAVSPRNDLALLEIADESLRLPPLTIAGGISGDMGEVSAIGYPMNVDLAQGLEIADIFSAQPPVKSRGFLSGQRPSRQFDSLLHTAPIARGNSGGPLLDGCGRVLGVNSFGADSDGSDAEFYFAVSLRELLPFLRENNVEPITNALPCTSIEELNAAERARLDQQRAAARARIEQREARMREARESARMQALLTISEERENAMALALLLLVGGIASGWAALKLRQRPAALEIGNYARSDGLADDSGDADDVGDGEAEDVSSEMGMPTSAAHSASPSAAPTLQHQSRAMIAAGLAGACFIGAVLVWITRPGFAELEDRVAAILGEATGNDATAPDGPPSLAGDGTMLCTFIPERSRVTGARTDDVEFDWAANGCVNARTQYGLNAGEWVRVFVPNDEAAVSINRYDPENRIFRTERYLLGRAAMNEARDLRRAYTPPSCGVTDAARVLGEQQSAITAALPDRPNERLVYTCEPKPSAGIGGADAVELEAEIRE